MVVEKFASTKIGSLPELRTEAFRAFGQDGLDDLMTITYCMGIQHFWSASDEHPFHCTSNITTG